MTCLPDVNVWIALLIAGHVHHKAAKSWFEESADDTVAFCRVTQMGLLRLLTNTQVMARDVLTADQAWDVLDQLEQDDHILFASEPPGIDAAWRHVAGGAKTGANFWTDAYLAAFAQTAGYTLVTFDKGFRKYKQLSPRVLG